MKHAKKASPLKTLLARRDGETVHDEHEPSIQTKNQGSTGYSGSGLDPISKVII